MKDKAQITLYVILGFVIIILASIFFLNKSLSQTSDLGLQKSSFQSFSSRFTNFQEYFRMCSEDAIVQANMQYGIREDMKLPYENFLVKSIDACMESLLQPLKDDGFDISKSPASANLTVSENLIIVNIRYPLVIAKDENIFKFQDFTKTFERLNTLKVKQGMVEKEETLLSTDKRALITFPKDTSISDENGNPVESVSLRVQDRNFDGLENSVVVGNLVYDAMPDGASFSQPVEIQISYDGLKTPHGMSPETLSIAYWDTENFVWKSLDTTYENGYLKAQTTHFSTYGVTIGCGGSKITSHNIVKTGNLFSQKYSFCNNSYLAAVYSNLKWQTVENPDALSSPYVLPCYPGFCLNQENSNIFLSSQIYDDTCLKFGTANQDECSDPITINGTNFIGYNKADCISGKVSCSDAAIYNFSFENNEGNSCTPDSKNLYLKADCSKGDDCKYTSKTSKTKIEITSFTVKNAFGDDTEEDLKYCSKGGLEFAYLGVNPTYSFGTYETSCDKENEGAFDLIFDPGLQIYSCMQCIAGVYQKTKDQTKCDCVKSNVGSIKCNTVHCNLNGASPYCQEIKCRACRYDMPTGKFVIKDDCSDIENKYCDEEAAKRDHAEPFSVDLKGTVYIPPMLMLHTNIADTREKLTAFARSMAELQQAGYRAVTYTEYYDMLANRQVPDKLILISIDDFSMTKLNPVFIQMTSVMESYGFKGTIGVNSPYGAEHADPQAVAFMQELSAKGWEFASHTKNHVNLADLSQSGIKSEVMESQKDIMAITGQPVDTLILPFGSGTLDNDILEVSQNLGVQWVLGIGGGQEISGEGSYYVGRVGPEVATGRSLVEMLELQYPNAK